MADSNDFQFGDSEPNLLRKILNRLKELISAVGGGGGGDVTLTVSDIEIGAVEIKDASTDTRAIVTAAGRLSVELPPGGSGLTDAELRASPVPVSVSGVATEATLATRLAEATFTARVNTQGQKTMAGSTPVVLASDQSTLPVSGPLTDAQLRATPVPVSGTVTATGPLTDAQLRASAVPISAASLPLPAGAATEATLATRLADSTFTGRINTQGQKTMAGSTPVVLASDQSTLSVSGPLTDAQLRASAVPISDANWITDGAAFSQESSKVVPGGYIFDEVAGVALTENDVAAARIDAKRAQVFVIEDATTRGQRAIVSAAGKLQVELPPGGTGLTDSELRATPVPVANDWRRNSTPKRYSISVILTPAAATALTNLMGLRKQSANADVYIIRIRTTVHQSAAGVSATLGWKRATTVAGGTLIAAADVPKIDTAAGNATLEVRTGNVTFGAEAAQYLLTTPGHTTAAPAAGVGSSYDWQWLANDRAGAIRLTGDEGLILEQIIASDVDNRFYVTVEWEEV